MTTGANVDPRDKGTPAGRRSLGGRIGNRLRLYLVRFNKNLIFGNRLRMFVYRYLIGMRIGKDSMIWAGNRINDPSNLQIGDNCIIGPGNVFLSRGGITIGRNVNLSGFGYFISQAHDVDDPNLTTTTLSPITIEDDAWIATNSTILPGIRIGRGGVVAAGSVVTKDVPPFTVVAGNPAQVVKERNRDIRYVLKDTKGIKWL